MVRLVSDIRLKNIIKNKEGNFLMAEKSMN